jgi:perosamine synthetase
MDFRVNESANIPVTDVLGVYSTSGQLKKVFRFYKRSTSEQQLMTSIVELQGDFGIQFSLVPLSILHLENSKVIQQLCDFRNEFISIYPNSIKATYESTRNWLSDLVLNNDSRILFLVIDVLGEIHGHLGFWLRDEDNLELDNVLKSPASNVKGLFSSSVLALEQWINEVVNTSYLNLRVLDSNKHAVKFYEKLEYQEVSREAMMWSTNSDGIRVLVNSEDGHSNEAWIVMKKNLESARRTEKVIPTAGPSITAFEIAYVNDAVRTGWNSQHSEYSSRFSAVFGDYVGARYVIPTDSCTSALHLGLWALGIGPGDEVIVPDLTWVATANAVKYVGAKPVFADIDPQTWCIELKSVESLITSKTKAIIPVHLYGYVADITSIESLAKRHNIRVLQDAAPGIGSSIDGKGVAEFGDFTAFSFQGAKLLVSGEGGVLTTNNKDLFDKAFKIADVGRKPGTFWIEEFGKKMKMSNLTAALALGQMQSVERQIEKKRRIREWYLEGLSHLDKLEFQVEKTGTRSIAWMTSINISNYGIDRDRMREELLALGVDTRPVFPAISTYPIWDETFSGNPVSNWVGANSINLPSGVRLNKSSVQFICEQISRVIEKS